jgi:hypothetical protein
MVPGWQFASISPARLPFTSGVAVDQRVTHVRNGERNIGVFLEGIELWRKSLSGQGLLPLWDHFVRVRLGHATHTTWEQAVKMKRLNVWADINLQSNIATMALPQMGPLPCKIEDFQQLNGDQLMAIYQNHGLFNMMAAGSHVTLGSDGAGVEHSELGDGFLIAHKLASMCQASAVPDRNSDLAMICNADFPSVGKVIEGDQDQLEWMV